MQNSVTVPDSALPTKFLPWIVVFSAALFFFYEFIQLNLFNAISSNLMSSFDLNAAHDFKTALLILPIGFVISLIAALLLKETHCRNKYNH